MAADEKWYFTKEELANTPSRKCGYDADKELSCRQQAANFIQDMGQRLQVTQLCINTAIVYMHRFYMFHSFTRFHRNAIAAAALFLAAKVEEQPRKLEHVIKVAQMCLHRDQGPLDIKSEYYLEQAQELVVNENILLQTLGFDVAIDHPHTHVVKCCHLVRAHKDLAQTSYFMASNSLHLTTMCLQYKPTVVACFCIHLACKWSNWEIPQSNEGKPWFWYIDKSVTQELLEQLTEEFLVIFEKCPSRLKKKIMSLSSSQHSSCLSAFNNEGHEKKRNGEAGSSQNQGQGLSFTGAGPSGMTSNNDDTNMKKKMEFAQRHHQDYKKSHLPHHSRPDQNVAPNKSSCMFGLPQRTVPSSHNSGSSNSISNTLGPPPTQSNSLPAPRSHHKAHPHPVDPRPRRPPPPPHVELQSLPFKKEHHHVPYSTSSPYQQQPSTVAEVPKLPPKPERSIFSPEVALTPEQPKPEPILRIKEEMKSPRVDEVAQPPPPKSPLEPLSLPSVVKEEKIDPKVEERITETKLPEPRKESVSPITISTSIEDHHKEAKKKKKKHKEHKEKHRDKHKHRKDKHKEPGPIVITIPKDKLLSIPKEVPRELPLKIKIPKDKIGPLTNSPVKIKIPREKLKESRKRERSPSPAVTSKHPRPNGTVQVNLELNTGLHETWEQSKTEGYLGFVVPEDDATTKPDDWSPIKVGNDRIARKSQLSRGRLWDEKMGRDVNRNVRELPRRGVGGRSRSARGSRGRGRGWHQAPPPPSYIPPYMYRLPAPLHHPHPYSYFIIPTYPPPPPLPDEPPPPQPPPPPPE